MVPVEKHILMTGAGGCIDRHVVPAPLELGQRVGIVDRRTEGTDPRAGIVVTGMFGGDRGIYQELGCPEIMVHMAWRDGFRHNSPAHVDSLAKHMHFIENLYRGGLEQLVVIGTMHEIGHWEGAIDENLPCNPQSLYGISKNVLHRFASLTAKRDHTVSQWIHAYYIIGDNLKGDSIFFKIARAALKGKARFPFTTDKNRYDFISTSELARQIALIANRTAVDDIINACSGQPQTLAQHVEAYTKENGYHVSLDYGAFPDCPYGSPGV